MQKKELSKKIIELKKYRNAIILAHNYQLPEIQDIADYLGDSLDLSRKAASVDEDVIVFCGVSFMAETAAILSPKKKVIHPVKDAGCSMADMVTAKDVIELKNKYPDAIVVSYVNSNADVKAVSDVCCTSANAEKIVRKLKGSKIIFVPDRNLGRFVKEKTNADMIIWDGYCGVHTKIRKEMVLNLKKEHPCAKVLAHPECEKEVVDISDEVLSTNGMCNYVKRSNCKEFIIATEEGMVYRLMKENPDKIFYKIEPDIPVCEGMKKITLESVLVSLEKMDNIVTVDSHIAEKAKIAIEKMIEMS